MLNRILVPLDQSQRSEKALPFAYELAQKNGATLTLLTVVTLLDTSETTPGLERVNEYRQERARLYLERRMGEAREATGKDVATELRVGPPADVIADVADEQDINVIVMSSEGESATGRHGMGSVALKVLLAAQCPVLVVRA